MLQCLKQKKLLLKFEKCEFHQFDVEFLEFVIKTQEVRMNLVKLEAIKD